MGVIRTKGLDMKKIIVPMLGIFLFSCASTENSDNSFTTLSNEPPATHHDKAGVKEAVIGVVLATSIGILNKDNFKCTKECEEALKESLANSTKYK